MGADWRSERFATQLADVSVKMIIYRAFIESVLEVPRHLARSVHDHYFNRQYDEFQARATGAYPTRLLRRFSN